MLLLLSLLALVAATAATCGADENLQYDFTTGTTSCLPLSKRSVSAKRTINKRWSVTDNEINTFDNWNGATIFSPIGKSPDGTASFGQAFNAPGTGFRNLLTGTFSFAGTSNTNPISFTPTLHVFNPATGVAGPAIWTGAPVVIETTDQVLVNKTIAFADATTAPELTAGVTYLVLFTTTSTQSGSVGRVSTDTAESYPYYLYIRDNAATTGAATTTTGAAATTTGATTTTTGATTVPAITTTVPAITTTVPAITTTVPAITTPAVGKRQAGGGKFILPITTYTLAFDLTFENVVDCVGSFIADPFYDNSLGVPTNCLETECASTTDGTAPGQLAEIYSITTPASINGVACPHTNGDKQLITPCTQTNPCVNCVQTENAPSACTSISAPPNCPAQTTTTYTTTVPRETSATAQTGVIPAICKTDFTTPCTCSDCVVDYNPCVQTACGDAAGTKTYKSTVVPQAGPGSACDFTPKPCTVDPVTPCVQPTE